MPRVPRTLSEAAKLAIRHAVRDERRQWEDRRLSDSARQELNSPRRAKRIKKRQQAIATLCRIQDEVWKIDQELFPYSKPLLAAVAEPFGRAISILGAPEDRDIEIEESLGTIEAHRERQCPVLMRTLFRLADAGEPMAELARYPIEDENLLQLPSADGLTVDLL